MFDVRRSSFKTIPYGINVTCERLQVFLEQGKTTAPFYEARAAKYERRFRLYLERQRHGRGKSNGKNL